jgi:uncharacterized protein involved in outer membrane biogenesis
MMKWIRRISFTMGLLFLILLVVSAIVVNKPEIVKSIINDLVSENLNRPFEIKGDIALSVYPKLIIDLENIHLANPEWSNRPDMVVVEKFHLNIDPKIIISNNVEIPQFQAQGISIFLEKNAEDEANWQFSSKTTKDKESSSFSLFENQLILRDITFQYTDVNKPIINGYISDFDASLTKQTGLMAALNGTIQDRPLKLSIVSDKEVAVNQAFPLTGTFDLAGEAQINIEGDLGWPLRSADTALRFSIEGNNLQKLGEFLSIPALSDPESYYLKAEINASEQGIALNNIDSVAGEISLAGDLALTIAEQAKLTSDIKLSINEQYKDLHIKLDMDTDAQAFKTGEAIPLNGKASLNDIAELDVNGRFAWPLGNDAIELALILKGDDLAKVGQLLAIEQLSYPEPYHIKATINASEQGIALNNIDSVAGEISLAGDLTLMIAEQVKVISDTEQSINEQYKDLAVKLEGKLRLNDIAELDAKGTFSWPLSNTATELDVVLKGDNLAKVGQLFAIDDFSYPEPYYLKAAINAGEQRIALSQIDASIGKRKLTGDVEVDIAEKAKLSSDLKLTIDDQYKDLEVKLAVTTDPTILEAETVVPVEGEISLSDIAQLDFNGELGWPLSPEHKTKLKVALKGKSLKKLGDRFVIPWLAKAVPYQLNGQIEADNKLISLKKISSAIGELKWTGNLSWPQQVPQKLSGDINVNYLDDEILTYFQPTTQSDSNGEIDKPDFDADIKLTVDELKIQQVHLSNITNQTKIHAGKVHIISEQDGDFFKKIHLDLKIDLNKKPWAYQVQAKANNISIAKPWNLITDDDSVSGEIEALEWDLSGVFIESKPLSVSKGVINLKNANLAIKQDNDSTFPIMMDFAQLSLEDNKEITIKLVAEESDDYKLPLDLTVTTNEKILSFLSSGEPLPVSLVFSANEARLTANGQVKYDGEKEDWTYQMKVDLKGPNLRTTASLFEQVLDMERKYELTATLKGNSSKVQLDDTDILIGKSKAEGEFLAEKSEKKWHLTTKLSSDSIDIDDILPDLDEADDEQQELSSNKKKLLSDKPFNISWLTAFDLDFDLDFKNVTNEELQLGHFTMVADLIDGVLRAKATIEGGYQHRKSGYAFELKAIGDELDLNLLADIEKIDIGSIFSATEIAEGVKLDADVKVQFQGVGESASQMVTQGSGDFKLGSGEGYLTEDIFGAWGDNLALRLLRPITPGSSQSNKQNNLHCAAAHFVLADGVIESRGIIIDTIHTTIGAQVQIKLPEETLKGQIAPEPKRLNLLSINTPVSLGGTVRNPTVRVENEDFLFTMPAKIFLGFYVGPLSLVTNVLASDAENPCYQALTDEGRKQKTGITRVITAPLRAFLGIFRSGEKEQTQ